jgi:hypothetical protein
MLEAARPTSDCLDLLVGRVVREEKALEEGEELLAHDAQLARGGAQKGDEVQLLKGFRV